MRMSRNALLAVVVVASVVALGVAQEKPAPPLQAPAATEAKKPEPPVLTELQKLQVQNLAQRIEIAQLRAQAAQQEFDRAREELTKLITSLQVAGYDLDLQRLFYVPKTPEIKRDSSEGQK